MRLAWVGAGRVDCKCAEARLLKIGRRGGCLMKRKSRNCDWAGTSARCVKPSDRVIRMACASCAVLAVRKCARLWKTWRIRATGYAAGRTAARVLERMRRRKAERTVAPQAYAPGTALAAAQKPTGLWKNTAHAKLMRARSRDSGRMAASAGFTAVVRTARMWYNRKRGAEPQAASTGGEGHGEHCDGQPHSAERGAAL